MFLLSVAAALRCTVGCGWRAARPICATWCSTSGYVVHCKRCCSRRRECWCTQGQRGHFCLRKAETCFRQAGQVVVGCRGDDPSLVGRQDGAPCVAHPLGLLLAWWNARMLVGEERPLSPPQRFSLRRVTTSIDSVLLHIQPRGRLAVQQGTLAKSTGEWQVATRCHAALDHGPSVTRVSTQ